MQQHPLQIKEGYNLGTFCIIDKRQGYINTDQQEMLKQMQALSLMKWNCEYTDQQGYRSLTKVCRNNYPAPRSLSYTLTAV